MVTDIRAVGIIQARIGSTRLPAKILAPIFGSQPLMAVLTQRIRPAGIPLWLATTSTRGDDVTAAWGHELGLHVFRGDEDDVLSRFAAIVDEAKPDWVVRFTADDPFTDAAITARALELTKTAADHIDLLTAGPNRQFPLGYAPQVVRASAIAQLARTMPTQGTHHRMHVTTGIEHPRIASIHDPSQPARPIWRWTVDTMEDLAMAQAAFAATMESSIHTPYREFVSILDKRPDITGINGLVRQKALAEG